MERALRFNGESDIFNTDQGAQYTSKEFQEIFKETKTKLSMDGEGRSLDKVYIERFWRTIKYDAIYLKDYENMEDAKKKEKKKIFLILRLTPVMFYD